MIDNDGASPWPAVWPGWNAPNGGEVTAAVQGANGATAYAKRLRDEQLRLEAAHREAERARIAREQEDAARKLRVTFASSITPRPTYWLWDTTPDGQERHSHGRIPLDSLALAGGAPGVGKSQFAAWLTATLTTGDLRGAFKGHPRSVVYSATEDSWEQTLVPRLIAAGADLGRVIRVDVTDERVPSGARLELPADVRRLGCVMRDHEGSLLIADPLISLLEGKVDDHRATQIRQALEPLVACASEFKFSVLGLMHFTKNGTSDPLARLSGSGAFGQVVRAALAFAREDANEPGEKPTFVMSQIKNNLGRLDLPSLEYEITTCYVDSPDGPFPASRMQFIGESRLHVRDILRDQASPDGGESRGEARAWLKAYLVAQGGSASRKDIAKAAQAESYSKTTLGRVRNDLGIEARRSGFPSESIWWLPEALP